jgi:hypothetical protein
MTVKTPEKKPRRGRRPNLARDTARILGDRTFTCDPPCICGCDQRYTSSGECVDCSNWRGSTRYRNHKDEIAAKARERYLRNKSSRNSHAVDELIKCTRNALGELRAR